MGRLMHTCSGTGRLEGGVKRRTCLSGARVMMPLLTLLRGASGQVPPPWNAVRLLARVGLLCFLLVRRVLHWSGDISTA